MGARGNRLAFCQGQSQLSVLFIDSNWGVTKYEFIQPLDEESHMLILSDVTLAFEIY